jgi:hypothetical protein
VNSTEDDAALHQLLGRIVYFHTLFIEPATIPTTAPRTSEPCCNHGADPGQRTAYGLLASTAWTALDEIAAGLGAHEQPCPRKAPSCCATCRIADVGASIAGAWIVTEHHAYDRLPPSASLLHTVRDAAATRLSCAFAHQHQALCPTRSRPRPADTVPLPDRLTLPLTGELLALWQNPLATTALPVASWLNHCTALSDVHHVLQTRKERP